jgi:hypothetical protein
LRRSLTLDAVVPAKPALARSTVPVKKPEPATAPGLVVVPISVFEERAGLEAKSTSTGAFVVKVAAL